MYGGTARNGYEDTDRCHARAGDNDLDSPLFRSLCVFEELIDFTMGGDDPYEIEIFVVLADDSKPVTVAFAYEYGQR